MPDLSQGAPLTYDYINALENRIDALERFRRNERAEQNIEILLDGNAVTGNARKPQDMLIQTGRIQLTWTGPAKASEFRAVRFDKQFKNPPFIVASVSDPPNGRNLTGKAYVAFATVTVAGVTRTGFNCLVETIRSGVNVRSGDIFVNYIAIGEK